MRVVILAKTRMGQNLCVGAAIETSGEPLRLIPQYHARYHSWHAFEPKIGQVVEILGKPDSRARAPHTEDYLVTRWQALPEFVQTTEFIAQRCGIWNGPPSNLFEGCLTSTDSGTRFLPKGAGRPANSIAFWRLPWALYARRIERDAQIKQKYASAGRFGFRVAYVGLDDQIEELPKGAIVRISLARWHQFRDEPVAKCWLQLSGWFL